MLLPTCKPCVSTLQAARSTLHPDLVAMSSVGPATLLLASPRQGLSQAVEELAGQHGCSLKYETAVDGGGLRSLPPRVVCVLGPPGAGKSTLCGALEEQLGPQTHWVSECVPHGFQATCTTGKRHSGVAHVGA